MLSIEKQMEDCYINYKQHFDSNNLEILKSTRVASTSISEDNKYLAIAEIDTSGTIIQSNIKIFSIDDVKNNTEN